MEKKLSEEEKKALLKIAREALTAAVENKPLPAINLASLPPALSEPGASFVTLTKNGQLRGCIGVLEAYQPLALDVQEHAVSAAMDDYRFPPVSRAELPLIEIEISRLTPPKKLEYDSPQDLLVKIRPGVDGVVLKDGFRRATFLPQVWEKIESPAEFLSHLCLKMGAPPDLWREKKLEVFTYQVEEFREER